MLYSGLLTNYVLILVGVLQAVLPDVHQVGEHKSGGGNITDILENFVDVFQQD